MGFRRGSKHLLLLLLPPTSTYQNQTRQGSWTPVTLSGCGNFTLLFQRQQRKTGRLWRFVVHAWVIVISRIHCSCSEVPSQRAEYLTKVVAKHWEHDVSWCISVRLLRMRYNLRIFGAPKSTRFITCSFMVGCFRLGSGDMPPWDRPTGQPESFPIHKSSDSQRLPISVLIMGYENPWESMRIYWQLLWGSMMAMWIRVWEFWLQFSVLGARASVGRRCGCHSKKVRRSKRT